MIEKRLTLKDYARVARPSSTDFFEDDLLYDLLRDRDLPDVTSYRALRRHLQFRGACDEALGAAPGVWRRYRAWRKRKRGMDKTHPKTGRVSSIRSRVEDQLG